MKFRQIIKIYPILKLLKISIEGKTQWVTELKDYNLKIIPKASKEIKKTDILLRQVNYKRKENNNKNIILLKSEWFA